jgi:hypothetical protein
MQPDKARYREGRMKSGVHRHCKKFGESATLAGIYLGLVFLVPTQGETVRGSPLDTIMNTHLFADVPDAKDFVRESRPAPDALDYLPLTGPDREGPKLRTKDELKALESELESAAVHNEQTARKRLGFKKAAGPKASQPRVRSGD